MSSSILDRTDPEPEKVLRYAPHSDGIIDTYLPSENQQQPRGAVLLLHGGSWRAQYDRRHMRPMASSISQLGFAVALPEFRRSGNGGEWPHIGADIEAALAQVRTWIHDLYGAQRFPLTIVGHSSGGHLALWSGLRAGSQIVQRIIAISPYSDVYRVANEKMADESAQELFGGSPAQQPRQYQDADPLRLLPTATHVVIAQGGADAPELVAMNRDVAKAHGGIDYREIEGADHFDVIDPASLHFTERILPLLLEELP